MATVCRINHEDSADVVTLCTTIFKGAIIAGCFIIRFFHEEEQALSEESTDGANKVEVVFDAACVPHKNSTMELH